MISTYVKFLLISSCVLLLAACETARPPFKIDNEKYGGMVDRKADSAGVLISKRANDVYELQYFTAQNNKAIAQSRNGTWSWTKNQPNADLAMDDALASCRERNQSHEDSAPCQLVNVNGFWIAEFSNKQ